MRKTLSIIIYFAHYELTPRIMKLSSLSILVLLNFVLPEFCMSLVSFPAKMTIPYAHRVLRRMAPRSKMRSLSKAYVLPSQDKVPSNLEHKWNVIKTDYYQYKPLNGNISVFSRDEGNVIYFCQNQNNLKVFFRNFFGTFLKLQFQVMKIQKIRSHLNQGNVKIRI